jgi:predicted transcriptional regulator
MKKLTEGKAAATLKVKEFLEAPLPIVNKQDSIIAPFNLLKNNNAIVVVENNKITDIITTIDIINYYLKSEKP